MKITSRALLSSLAAAAVLAAAPAFAHHPMGGQLPATLTHGLLSGLGHPILGLDHLAALLAVGLIASRLARGALLPVAWVTAMAAGAALHAGRVDLPYAEVMVALSVIALGVMTARRPTLPLAAIAALFGAGGFVHGFALGESIVGAEPTPLAAYFVGLVVSQSLIALGAFYGARWLGRTRPEAAPVRLRYAGIAVALVGAAALALALPGLA